jgi:hypothetical protein
MASADKCTAIELSWEFIMKRFGHILSVTSVLGVTLLLPAAVLQSRPTFAETTAVSAESGNRRIANGCTVDVSEFPSDRTSAKELYFLMEKYFLYCHSDLSVLDEIYEAEARDDQWAVPLEEKIKAAGAGAEGPITGECHRSLCRFDFESSTAKRWGILDYSDRFRALSVETHIVAHFAPSARHGFRGYFFSDVSPPAFLDSFLKVSRP